MSATTKTTNRLVVREPSFVEVGGRRIAYDEVRPANPKGTVLLLTGLASKRLGWRMQMEPFGAVYRTIAMDHRDAGDSDEADTRSGDASSAMVVALVCLLDGVDAGDADGLQAAMPV